MFSPPRRGGDLIPQRSETGECSAAARRHHERRLVRARCASQGSRMVTQIFTRTSMASAFLPSACAPSTSGLQCPRVRMIAAYGVRRRCAAIIRLMSAFACFTSFLSGGDSTSEWSIRWRVVQHRSRCDYFGSAQLAPAYAIAQRQNELEVRAHVARTDHSVRQKEVQQLCA